jgi:Ca2+-transporting ATPase
MSAASDTASKGVIQRPPAFPWHMLTPDQARERLGLTGAAGLTAEQAGQRMAQYGPNQLREEKRVTFFDVFWEEVREPMILLLIGTGILYTILGSLTDAFTILGVILALVGVEVFNEYRAGRAIRALSKLAEPTTPVLRGGETAEIPPEEVVPGDIIVLQAGWRW